MILLRGQASRLERASHILALCFLLSILFVPYQTHWFNLAPQTVFLLLGSTLSLAAFVIRGRWREVRLDWPLLLFAGALLGSIFYHQSFNVYSRAYVLSFAAYLWLRHTLKNQNVTPLIWVSVLFLLCNVTLIGAQIFISDAWFVARYFTNLESFRIPMGFFDIPTTATITPAIAILFLISMQVQQKVKPSHVLNLLYFITPFSIILAISRTTILSFLVTLAAAIFIYRREFRYIWRPTLFTLLGFVVSSVFLFKSQGVLNVSDVFEYKIARPALALIKAQCSLPQNNPVDVDNCEQIQVDSSLMSRLAMWEKIILNMASNTDLLWHGVGIGNSEKIFKKQLENGEYSHNIFGNNSVSPHNSFIEVFYEGGVIVGVALLVFVTTRIFGYENWRSPWFLSLIFLVIAMLFWDLLRMRYFWIVLALVEVYRDSPRSETNALTTKKDRQ